MIMEMTPLLLGADLPWLLPLVLIGPLLALLYVWRLRRRRRTEVDCPARSAAREEITAMPLPYLASAVSCKNVVDSIGMWMITRFVFRLEKRDRKRVLDNFVQVRNPNSMCNCSSEGSPYRTPRPALPGGLSSQDPACFSPYQKRSCAGRCF